MGCIYSCLGLSEDNDKSNPNETEMIQKIDRNKAISAKMSNPNIRLSKTDEKEYENIVSGFGLALASISIEQDAAYWEWHIEDNSSLTTKNDGIKFGVSTSKNRQFYLNKEADDDGTSLMRAIPNLKHGDTVGVAVQQSDLPMIQFLVNGEPLHQLAINRFRGTVYPSIWLPVIQTNDDSKEYGENSEFSATIIFDEDKFRELAPHARFGPLISARGII